MRKNRAKVLQEGRFSIPEQIFPDLFNGRNLGGRERGDEAARERGRGGEEEGERKKREEAEMILKRGVSSACYYF